MQEVTATMGAIQRAHDNYEKRSGTASTICRQLGFAAIALVWAFRLLDGGRYVVRPELVKPTLLVVSSLALDLLHYAVAAAMWGGYGRFLEWREAGHHQIPEDAPGWINWPALVMFWGKLCLMMWAYWLLFGFLRAEVLGIGAT